MSNELQQDREVEVGAPYTRTHWENNKTPLNAANLNNIENGIEQNAKAIFKETNERKLADIAINTELDAVEKKTGFVYDENSGVAEFNIDELLTILNNPDLSDLQKGVAVRPLLKNYTLSQMFMMLYRMYIDEVGDMYYSQDTSGGTIYRCSISDGLENRMSEKNLISAVNNLYSWVKNIIGIDDIQFLQGYNNAKDNFANIHSDLSSLSSVVQIFNKIYEFVLNNKSSIQLLNSSEDVKGSVKNTVVTEIAKVIAGAPEDLDTLKEIADWIESHPETVAQINSSIKSNTDAINEIKDTYATQEELEEVASKVSENIDISNLISYGTEDPDGSITSDYYVKLDDSEVEVKGEEIGTVVLNVGGKTSEANYAREGHFVLVSGNVPDIHDDILEGTTYEDSISVYHEDGVTPFYKPAFNVNLIIRDTGAYSAVYSASSLIEPIKQIPDNGHFSFTFYTSEESII